MKAFPSGVVLLALLGAAGIASPGQQRPSTVPAAPGEGAPPQQESDKATAQQSARSFEGKIARAQGQFVLLDRAAQTSYKLDDQEKARKFAGRNVKVMATMDPVTNLLHVIDISIPKEQ